jgi:hypothetical protein
MPEGARVILGSNHVTRDCNASDVLVNTSRVLEVVTTDRPALPCPAQRPLKTDGANNLTMGVVTDGRDKPEVVTRFRHCEQVLSRP